MVRQVNSIRTNNIREVIDLILASFISTYEKSDQLEDALPHYAQELQEMSNLSDS